MKKKHPQYFILVILFTLSQSIVPSHASYFEDQLDESHIETQPIKTFSPGQIEQIQMDHGDIINISPEKVDVITTTGQRINHNNETGEFSLQGKVISVDTVRSQTLKKNMFNKAFGNNKVLHTMTYNPNSKIYTITTKKGTQTLTTTIDSLGMITNKDAAGNVVSTMQVAPDGIIHIKRQSKQDEPAIIEIIQPNGEKYMSQTFNDKLIEQHNDEPQLTTILNDIGRPVTTYKNYRGSQTTIRQNGYTMEIETTDGKGFLGTGIGKSKGKKDSIDFSKNVEQILRAKPADRPGLIDKFALKATGDKTFLNSPQFITIKQNYLEILQKNAPKKPATKLAWFGQLFKRIVSADDVSTAAEQIKITMKQQKTNF